MVNHWGAGNQYNVGEVVYEGYYYKNIQAHTSQNDWTPDRTPALWGRQGRCGDDFYSSTEDVANSRNAYEEVSAAEHKAKLSHELIAGAAAFEAARAWEHHKAESGL